MLDPHFNELPYRILAAACGEPNARQVVDSIHGSAIPRLHPTLLALSFCHCRNVDLEEIRASRSERRRNKNEPSADIRWHNVKIESMKRIFDPVRAERNGSLQSAMLICRGHFKHFKDKGLFGKHRGLWWWDMHVRGASERGVIKKTYTVTPPNS